MAGTGPITVEEVHGRVALRRFVELPWVLHRGSPRWAPPLPAYERTRLDPDRNPFFESGDAAYLLARRAGRIAGRLTAHVAAEGDDDGWFGFLEADDDERVFALLLDGARDWLREQGCTTITGPASFTLDEEGGVLVAGHEVAGVTGRSWQPPWCATHLAACGLTPVVGLERRTWRWRLEPDRDEAAPTGATARRPETGRYGDPRLVLDGITAVPDLAGALRQSPLALARAARAQAWDTACVVAVDGDPTILVPRLATQAAACGYESLIAPVAPAPEAEAETIHAVFRADL